MYCLPFHNCLFTIFPADLKVTMNDYAVYLTPEGQLFDRTAVDNLKESSNATNIKLENKAYSYKEQMEDIGKNPASKIWDQFMLNCSKNSQ